MASMGSRRAMTSCWISLVPSKIVWIFEGMLGRRWINRS
jgi:hypothetical protein